MIHPPVESIRIYEGNGALVKSGRRMPMGESMCRRFRPRQPLLYAWNYAYIRFSAGPRECWTGMGTGASVHDAHPNSILDAWPTAVR